MGSCRERDACDDPRTSFMKTRSSTAILIAILLGGFIVAGAVYLSFRHTGPETGNPSLVRPISISDHILGNPAAKVLIVTYSDFDCTFCKDFDVTLRRIVADMGTNGDVALVFREFPLTEIHPNAFSHARAAECAAQVGGNDVFWDFTEEMFASQPIDPSQYGTLAVSAGISDSTFATCYATASSTLDAHINADRQNALDMGANGTPYSLIHMPGKTPVIMNGAYSYDAVKLLVTQALAQ